MGRFIIQRILIAIPLLFFIITANFFFIRIAPGGPFDTERPLPKETRDAVLKAYDLDKPLFQQYLMYMTKVVTRFDLGPSFKYRDYTVNELIAKGFPVSMQIGFIALAIAFIVGTSMGFTAALNKNSALDYIVMGFSMIGISVPRFVMAYLVIMFLALKLKWLPVAGWGEPRYMIAPVLVLTLHFIAYFARLSRTGMLDIINQDYILTARAKGLNWITIIFKHALKGAILPCISFLGPAAAAIITGSMVVETIFGVPGMGRYFILSALNRDYTMVMGSVIVYSVLIISFNLIVDIAYGYLDPRIVYHKHK